MYAKYAIKNPTTGKVIRTPLEFQEHYHSIKNINYSNDCPIKSIFGLYDDSQDCTKVCTEFMENHFCEAAKILGYEVVTGRESLMGIILDSLIHPTKYDTKKLLVEVYDYLAATK